MAERDMTSADAQPSIFILSSRARRSRPGPGTTKDDDNWLLVAVISGIRQNITIGYTAAVAIKQIVSNRTTTNDNDPFVGGFERLAGTEKREPYGEPFGNRSHIRRPSKDTCPKD